MNISVFGMGYVGCVSAACLAQLGHKVIGVDVSQLKVDTINRGASPIVEPELDALIGKNVRAGRLRATTEAAKAVATSDVALISVGTPSRQNGSLDTTHVRAVAMDIGWALRARRDYYVVVVRSTVLPGTVEEIVIPALEESSGKSAGSDFGVCINPEFLREGASVEDFYHPPKIVIGSTDRRAGDVVAAIYAGIEAPVFRANLKVAGMVKYCDNAFHALKVAFANEIGRLCKRSNIDSHEVMEIFCADTKLNIAPTYLKPGFAFGGSCLPKDLRALTYKARASEVETPLLSAIIPSNEQHIMSVARELLRFRGRTIGFLGLAFKGATDDLRESPIVEVIEFLIGKGFTIKIYDGNVSYSRLLGTNKEYIERAIPHIACLLCSTAEEVVRSSDVVVVGNINPEYRGAVDSMRSDQTLIDLVRIIKPGADVEVEYVGIGW